MSITILHLITFDAIIQACGCFFAIYFKTERYFDIFGAITNFALAYASLQVNEEPSNRQNILSFLVMMWAIRLGLFLFFRVLKRGDRRFKNAKENPMYMMIVWSIQGLWCFLTLLPTLLLNLKTDDKDRPLNFRDYIGLSIFSFGFMLEMIADYQKTIFINNPNNKDKFISIQLWSYCRHPNYLGEIILWFGAYICSSTSFEGWEQLSIFSPIFVVILLTKISGIPLLEKRAIKKWGNDKLFKNYMLTTKRLIPGLW